MIKPLSSLLVLLILSACQPKPNSTSEVMKTPFMWENASIYFLLTDRFYNADTTNDVNFERASDGAVLRNFMGGDLAGITAKIEEGYFDQLGVSAIWFTPPVEQIHGAVDEGTGKTYGYHGYWARDWTSIDPNFGTMDELKLLVKTAHQHGIRILMDVVMNHTGPVTPSDSQWPDTWVRTSPQCTYTNAETTIACTLVENLPDVRTELDVEVDLPVFLLEKWEREGRLEQELAELDAFFEKTGYPRAPRFYIMKWLSDYVRELGIDGYRVDTAKHTEASIWAELYAIASAAFEAWKVGNPAEVLDDQPFFMVGEVYGYSIHHGRDYPYSDAEKVDFYQNGFKSLINFGLKSAAGGNPEEVFSYYADQLNGPLKGYTVLNYLTSHDDGDPFDRNRERSFVAATMLMLAPGQAQIYYGDELARPLTAEGSQGDADLRTVMNWDDLEKDDTRKLLAHWQKLGRFRMEHLAVGAGEHRQLREVPYTFARFLTTEGYSDEVVVVLENTGQPVDVAGVFEDGERIVNYYTGEEGVVSGGKVAFGKAQGLMLLARKG